MSVGVGGIAIERPGKIIAVGLNYKDHASETDADPPKAPILFAKFPTALIGHGAAIQIPDGIDQVDWEAELAVVIGATARSVSVPDALAYVRGYACLNDVSARRAQAEDGQWTRAKSFDTFCPLGPRLVPAEEISDPQVLDIRSRVNGEVMQSGNTRNMIFSVAELIAYISHGITLEPGDIIATGTPSGVGAFRAKPIFLKPGDTVEIEIPEIGILSNPIESETT
jgi:2,4-didehydro-3-deoxy-L-rhamnonate hydrolase